MFTKKEAENLMKMKGESRGMNIKIDLDFVIEEKGREGLKRVEAKMVELGFPLKYKEIKPMGFYPVALEALILLSIKEVFNFDNKEIEKMGRSVVKFSLLMKIFMKYFGSLRLIAKEVPKIWQKHYTVGTLEMSDFSEEKKYAILREKDFKIDPIYCLIHRGYFTKVAEMVLKSIVTCKETKCVFKGDKYHEFLLTWQ